MSTAVSPIDTLPYSPSAELDGGDPAVRFFLAASTNNTPFSTAPQTRRQIFVRRQAWDDTRRILAVVERTISAEAGDIIRESERFLDLYQDFVLPIYALPRPATREWNIEIAYGQGALRVDYPFGTRDDAFRFQEVLTGYVPVAHFDDITCVATYKAFRLRQPQYVGFGQVQLWKQVEKAPQVLSPRTDRSLSPVSSTGSSSSAYTARPWGDRGRAQTGASVSSPTSTWRSPQPISDIGLAQIGASASPPTPTRRSSRPMSIASIQSGYSTAPAGSIATVQTHHDKGTSVLVTQDIRPPLLVAFLKDNGKSEGYTMLKLDIKDLTQTEFTTPRREDAALKLEDRSKSPFRVDKHLPSPGHVPLSAWNLCMEPQRRFSGAKKDKAKGKAPVAPLVDHLECSNLVLSFGSRKDPANLTRRENLDRCMLELQMRYLERLAGQTATRDAGIVAMTEEMRAPPVSPPPTTRLSRIYEPPELLPEIDRQSIVIGTDFIDQAGTVDSHRARMTAELDVASGAI
ncbi:hypothetical protein V8F20_006462 [Naviculisporaceae sp. PSN 640]